MANTALIEPLLLRSSSPRFKELNELAFDLAKKSSALRASLNPAIAGSIKELIRSMNCYYSNLIEGHNTHPIDIEQALQSDYSEDSKQRDLQREAVAHIETEKWIESGGLKCHVASAQSLLAIHRYFCGLLPPDLLWAEGPDAKNRLEVVPGELRQHAVKVGRHIPIDHNELPAYMARFEQVYTKLGKAEMGLAIAAAHHRFVWMHPFLDGNGRVSRLMSQYLVESTFDAGGLWSVSRGFARQKTDYMRLLAACDGPRHSDIDGRGQLSEKALIDFTEFFLTTCHDQVDFMEALLQTEKLASRVEGWTMAEIASGRLPKLSLIVMKHLLSSGEVTRQGVETLTGLKERAARNLIRALMDAGAIYSKNKRAPLRLHFSAVNAEFWLPALFAPR